MSPIVGIDLGTTNSVIAVLDGTEPRVITNEEGARVTPSVVGFTEGGEVLVGEIARRQAVMNPEATVYSIKRFMGQRYAEVESEAKRMTYQVVEADSGDAAVKVRGVSYSPPEVAARVLLKLKRGAELHLGETITEAVITVPAYFNDAQRKATRDAGKIAGLEVRRIINEPTAAALCYGLDRKGEEVVAVYDFGGGTFDISVLEVGQDVVEVLSTSGDTHLGGDDIDARLVTLLVEHFKTESGLDVSQDRMVQQRLREAAEKAKIELSSIMETEINLPFLTADATGPKHLNLRLTRAMLDREISDLVERTLEACKRALSDADKLPGDIDEVILVGGSTRIPWVQKRVTEFFGREPHRGVNPDEVVALGAAIQAGVLSGALENVLLLDVTPLSLGVETSGGVMTPVLPRNTTIPTRRTKMFSTVVDNQSTVAIHVCQGERDFVKDNRSLGRFELSGIPNAPRATPQVEVAFDVDANGILNVTAQEKNTGRKAEITITGAGGLTADEVRRAVHEAQMVEGQDKARRRKIEKRNKLQGLINDASRRLFEYGHGLDEAQRAAVDDALRVGRQADGSDKSTIEDFDAAIAGLTTATRVLVEAEYERKHADEQAFAEAAQGAGKTGAAQARDAAEQGAAEETDEPEAADDDDPDDAP